MKPKDMSDEALNVAIAEAVGYTFHDVKSHKGEDVYEKFWLRPGVKLDDITADDICFREGTSPPRYTASRDACAEVERGLTDEQHYQFRVHLWEITAPQKREAGFDMKHNRDYASPRPRQRAEAIYLTLTQP